MALKASLLRQNPRQHLVNLCCLRGLTNLELEDPFGVIHEIPPEIGQLTALVELRLSSRSPQDLAVPPEISKLQQLERLILRDITDCNRVFSSLPKLAVLVLTGADLTIPTAFPSPLGMPRLSSLKLLEVCLYGPMWGLSCLHSLRDLHLGGIIVSSEDLVTDISVALGRLTMLTKLWMAECPFNVDLPSLGALTGLSFLALPDSGLRDFACCTGWCSLTHLMLDSNCLTRLPSDLTALTALVQLDVCKQNANFQLDESLWETIRAMPALRHISLSQEHFWNPLSLYHLLYARDNICHMDDFYLNWSYGFAGLAEDASDDESASSEE